MNGGEREVEGEEKEKKGRTHQDCEHNLVNAICTSDDIPMSSCCCLSAVAVCVEPSCCCTFAASSFLPLSSSNAIPSPINGSSTVSGGVLGVVTSPSAPACIPSIARAPCPSFNLIGSKSTDLAPTSFPFSTLLSFVRRTLGEVVEREASGLEVGEVR